MRLRKSVLFLVFLLLCLSCSLQRRQAFVPAQPTVDSVQESKRTNGSTDPLQTKFFEGDSKGAEAWRKFMSEGQYRLAQAQDFNFSDNAKKQLLRSFGDSWQSRVFNPYTGGDINHDRFFHDNAYIVVAGTRNDSQKFGLVIFNEHDGDEPHTRHWLYTNKDLSTTALMWDSSGLHLEEYDEQGAPNICYVNWNEKEQQYSCDSQPKLRQSDR